MSTKAPSNYNHLPLLPCSAVLARQLCGEPAPVCHCHPAEWEWALEATIEMNQIHHCLQGRGAEQHSLMHREGRGASMGAAYPGHPTLWKLHWFHHCLVLLAKVPSTLSDESSAVFLVVQAAWFGRCLQCQNNVSFWTRINKFLRNVIWNVTL